MTVAIVHYHLGPGGVTQVIRAASAALLEAGVRHVILTGSAPQSGAPLPHEVVEGLGYRDSAGEEDARLLEQRLRTAAAGFLGAAPDLWHIHNPTLGKNPALTACVARLAEAGERLVLQIHDLAEEGRPFLYQKIRGIPKRYPFGPRIRYAFLNTRDRAIFTAAGLPESQSAVIPNPPTTAGAAGPPLSPTPLLFAPVRGIRRKNLGELVLLSILTPPQTRIAVSRAPSDPEALRLHEVWRNFALRFAPRIAFDVCDKSAPAEGADAGFESWIRHCTHVVGTSVAEGYGLPFVEAAAWRRPFLGRRLAHLDHDLPHARLYDRLLIPAEWIGRPVLTDQLKTTLERHHRACRIPLERGRIEATLEALWDDGWLDFGNLPEALQQAVIERCTDATERSVPLVQDRGKRHSAAAWLAESLTAAGPVFPAATSVPYQDTLRDLYQAEDPAGAQGVLDPQAILRPHLTPQAFHFLLSPPRPAVRRPDRFDAVIFDIYGTLVLSPPGAVRPNPAVDAEIRAILRKFGHEAPDSPTTSLHEAVLRHHAASPAEHPEVDLRKLWSEILGLPPDHDCTALVIATEDARVPTRLMPGAAAAVHALAAAGVSLGLLSNAQCNSLRALEGLADFFDPDLTVLSYQHGIAKPSPALFARMASRLEHIGLETGRCLFVGNDPIQDMVPASAAGFQTALFTGHPDSLRPGAFTPDFVFNDWKELLSIASADLRID